MRNKRLHPARTARGAARVSRGRLRRRRRRGGRRRHARPRPTEERERRLRLDHACWPSGPAPRASPSRPCSTASRRRTRTSPSGTSRRRIPPPCSRPSVEGGNPPDIAALPSPGIMADFAGRGALTPIDFAQDDDRRELRPGLARARHRRGRALRRLLQGRQQVDGLVQRCRVRKRRRRAARGLGDVPLERRDAGRAGMPAYSIGGSDGWTLTDLFENIYLRTAGPEKYDQLTTHEIPWTDQSVKDALTEMGKVLGDTDNIAGGTTGALQTDFPTSVTQVYSDPPKAAQVMEGDFVGGVIADETQAEAETGYNVYQLPGHRRLRQAGRGRRRRDGHVQGQPGRAGADRVPGHARGGGDLGREGRLLVAEQERRRLRLPRRDHAHDGDGARRRGGLPLRPLRPAARRVRQRRDVQHPAGLPAGPRTTSTARRRSWRRQRSWPYNGIERRS